MALADKKSPDIAGSDAGGTVTFTLKNKVGFVLAGLWGLSDLPAVFFATPEGDVGPPMPVLILSTLSGLVTLIGVGIGWARHNRAAIRAAAGARIVSMLLGLPAFFVEGVPPALRILTAAAVVVTIATVVLMLSPAPRRTLVED